MSLENSQLRERRAPPEPPPAYTESAEIQGLSQSNPDVSSFIEIDDPICEVSFGEVYNARWTQIASLISDVLPPVAIRKIRAPHQPRGRRRCEQFRTMSHLLIEQTAIWKSITHENILHVLGYATCADPDSEFWIVSSWTRNGTIIEYLAQNPNTLRLPVVAGVANGLAFLHSRVPQLIHGNLIPANILADAHGNPLLFDIGIQTIVNATSLWPTAVVLPSATLRWTAPELMISDHPTFDAPADIYSFGMSTFEIFTGYQPFQHCRSDEEIKTTVIIEQRRPGRPSGRNVTITDSLWDIWTQSWAAIPTNRPSMADIQILINSLISQAPTPRRAMPSAPGELFSGSEDGIVRIWNTESGEQSRVILNPSKVNVIALSPDRTSVVTGCGDNTARIWDAQSLKELKCLSGHSGSVLSVAFSPDGVTIASGSADNTVLLWSAKSGNLQHNLKSHTSWVWGVSFTPDGRRIASASADRTIKIWEAGMTRLIRTITGHTDCVNCVSFSPDGLLASGSADKTIRIWNIESGQQMLCLSGHKGPVRSVNFSPDGGSVVSSSNDNSVRIWKSDSGRQVKSLNGHNDIVWSVSFSPDGGTLASASRDQTIRIWDVRSGEQLKVLVRYLSAVRCVTFV